MERYREKVTLRGTADCPFQQYYLLRSNANATFSNTHWHPEAEILYIQKGAVEVRIDKSRFSLLPGHIAFIPPGVLHSMNSIAAQSSYYAFVFSLDLLSLPENHFFQKELIAPLRAGTHRFPYLLLPEESRYCDVSSALDKICQCPENDPHRKGVIFLSMILLFSSMKESLVKSTTHHLEKNNNTVKLCLQFMESHCTEHLTLKQIADHVHLHPNYLCALFKDYTGQTVFQHLIRIRIEKAANLLRRGNITVSQVAIACGFDSAGFFSEKFKSFMGISPKEYSMQHK